MSRLIALVVAAALVGGALFVRSRLDGGGLPVAGPAEATLLCVSELRAVCEELARQAAGGRPSLRVEIADAWDSVEALSADDAAEPTAWLTFDPFPEILTARRDGAGLAPLPGEPEAAALARSPLVLAIWDDRAAALEAHCASDITWSCIGDVAGRTWTELGGEDEWGPVKPGYADPSRSAEGIFVLAQAASSRLGGPPTRQSLADNAFFGWFSGLQDAVPSFRPSAGTPLQALPLTMRADYDAVGTTEAAAVALRERAPSRVEGLTIRASEPVMTADVVVTPLGEDGSAVIELVREIAPEVLSAHGWRVDGAAPAGGLASAIMAEANGLPPPGGLEALRSAWSEVTR